MNLVEHNFLLWDFLGFDMFEVCLEFTTYISLGFDLETDVLDLIFFFNSLYSKWSFF